MELSWAVFQAVGDQQNHVHNPIHLWSFLELGGEKFITVRLWVIWMSEKFSCGSSCCQVCWWWSQDYMCRGMERGGSGFSFLIVGNILFLFQCCHWFVFGNTAFSLGKWRDESCLLVVFQQHPATSLKAHISPVLLHRHLPFQYFCRKDWIWSFFLWDVVLGQSDYTLNASSKPTHEGCSDLCHLAAGTSGNSIGWAISVSFGALCTFAFFVPLCCMIFFF